MFYLLFYIIVQIIPWAGLDSFVGRIQPAGRMFDTPALEQSKVSHHYTVLFINLFVFIIIFIWLIFKMEKIWLFFVAHLSK